MRYRLGLPIDYHPLHFGFYYTEAVTSFPNIEVSEGEITALFVAQKALAQYKGTPFERPLQSAFRKMTDGLKDRVSFSWNDLEDAISFRSAARAWPISSYSKPSAKECSAPSSWSSNTESSERRLRIAPGPAVHHLARKPMVPLRRRPGAQTIANLRAAPHAQRPANDQGFPPPGNFSIAQVLSGSFGVFEREETSNPHCSSTPSPRGS